MLEAILVGIIDAFLLRKTMQFCSGVDTPPVRFPKKSPAQEASAFLDEAQLHKAGRKVRRSWLVEVGQINAAA